MFFRLCALESFLAHSDMQVDRGKQLAHREEAISKDRRNLTQLRIYEHHHNSVLEFECLENRPISAQKFGTEYKIDIMLNDASDESQNKLDDFFNKELPFANLSITRPASRI